MLIQKLVNKLFPSKQAVRVRPWVKINGDKTLRLNYDLNTNSTVFDLGGYEGQWASDIFSKYQCTIYVFEPYTDYAEGIEERFKANNKIKLFKFGLGKDDKKELLYINNNASSAFRKKGQPFPIEIKKASTFINNNNISHIDLIKINIEGGEYDLLQELIEADMIKNIKNLQIQFHDFVPDAFNKMKHIQRQLAVTHQLTYHFEFVWENWELKK